MVVGAWQIQRAQLYEGDPSIDWGKYDSIMLPESVVRSRTERHTRYPGHWQCLARSLHHGSRFPVSANLARLDKKNNENFVAFFQGAILFVACLLASYSCCHVILERSLQTGNLGRDGNPDRGRSIFLYPVS